MYYRREVVRRHQRLEDLQEALHAIYPRGRKVSTDISCCLHHYPSGKEQLQLSALRYFHCTLQLRTLQLRKSCNSALPIHDAATRFCLIIMLACDRRGRTGWSAQYICMYKECGRVYRSESGGFVQPLHEVYTYSDDIVVGRVLTIEVIVSGYNMMYHAYILYICNTGTEELMGKWRWGSFQPLALALPLCTVPIYLDYPDSVGQTHFLVCQIVWIIKVVEPLCVVNQNSCFNNYFFNTCTCIVIPLKLL